MDQFSPKDALESYEDSNDEETIKEYNMFMDEIKKCAPHEREYVREVADVNIYRKVIKKLKEKWEVEVIYAKDLVSGMDDRPYEGDDKLIIKW